MLVELDMRQEQAQLAAAEAQRDLARLNLDRTSGLADEGIISQLGLRPGRGRAQAGRGPGRRDSRDHRPQADPRALHGHAGHPPGQPGPVPERRAIPSCRCRRSGPDLRQLQRAAAGSGDSCRRGTSRAGGLRGPRRSSRPRAGSRPSTSSWIDEGRATSRSRPAFANPDGACAPACSCGSTWSWAPSAQVVALPASAISYAPYGDSVFVVAEVKGPNGQTYRGVRQQFVKLGGTRGTRWRSSRVSNAGEEVVTSGASSSQRRRRRGETTSPAHEPAGAEARGQLMTAIHRPLRQAARPGDRRQPRDPDRRACRPSAP